MYWRFGVASRAYGSRRRQPAREDWMSLSRPRFSALVAGNDATLIGERPPHAGAARWRMAMSAPAEQALSDRAPASRTGRRAANDQGRRARRWPTARRGIA